MGSAIMPDKLSEEVPILIPGLIDERAKETPKRTYASIPISDDLEDGWHHINYTMLQRAIDRMSWWLDENIPRKGDFDVLTYYGANDLGYPFLAIACQKTRRVFLHLHDNNSHTGDLKLLDETACHTLLSDPPYTARFTTILQSHPNLILLPFPTLNYFLSPTSAVQLYPYNPPNSFSTALTNLWLIAQSSGTTGTPKRINVPIAYQHCLQRSRRFNDSGLIESLDMWSRLSHKRFILPWPMTWLPALEIMTDLLFAWEYIPVLLPARTPAELAPPELVRGAIELADVVGAALVPFYLKGIAKQGVLGCLAKLEMVGFAGAGVERELVEKVGIYTKVQSLYGQTDVGSMPMLASQVGDGRYVGLSGAAGCVLEAAGEGYEEGVCELVLRRERDTEEVVPLFWREAGLREFRTNGLFRRHPENENFWLPVGRKDDLWKNAKLTKFEAVNVEGLIEKEMIVRGVILGGQALEKPFLIVEVDDLRGCGGVEGVMGKVWPKVEEANRILSKELTIERDRVVLTDMKVKALPRLGKGTVNRRVAVEQFAKEIEALP